ncbi:MAG: ATP phosphoribosyltransferase [Deltaproteobacteria bacterium]|nr:ATP phosphoribosyltransferase [Deltaproteobacteria bacterium]
MTRTHSERLTIAMPSKGTLHEKTLDFLRSAGLRFRPSGPGRDYVGTLGGAPGVDVLLLRADEIPERLESGGAQIGITGEDLRLENGSDAGATYRLIPDLGYGHARLVVAVPRVWIDVSNMHDLEEVASIYRVRHGRPLRVATKFPRLTREFFVLHGVRDYMIVRSLGATEGAPASGAADLSVDLSSTGATLAQNHLKDLEDGTIVDSQAGLMASANPDHWNDARCATLVRIVDLIESRMAASNELVLRAWAPRARARAIFDALNAGDFRCAPMTALPSEAEAQPDGTRELVWLCRRDVVQAAAKTLRDEGCTGVVATAADFVFRPTLERLEEFRALVEIPTGATP